MEILCPSEGAYPLWPKPGRLSAGYAAAHTDSHAHMCAVFAVHTVLLLCQICQFRAWGIRLLARPLPGQPPLVHIGSPVLGATWHARCAEVLAWQSTCVCPLSGPRSWTTAFPHALWHGSVCCIRCTHLPPVLSARCLRLVSLLVGRPSRGIGGTERSATSPLPTPACSRLRFLVLLQDSPPHEGCILCLRVRRRAYRPKSMRTVYLLSPVKISLWCVARICSHLCTLCTSISVSISVSISTSLSLSLSLNLNLSLSTSTSTSGVGWDGVGWDEIGWDGMGWDGMGWDGMRWGWDGTGWGSKTHTRMG